MFATLSQQSVRPLLSKPSFLLLKKHISSAGCFSTMASSFDLGICQFAVGADKDQNLQAAERACSDAVDQGADIVVLPECFNCPYDVTCFPRYAEPANEQGGTFTFLRALAKDKGIFLVGGSIPERGDDGNVYNTSLVFNPEGDLIAKHRKVHLFDIDIPGKITFKESETLSPGNKLTVFSTPYCNIGLAICYDMRFPELHRLAALEHDAKVICLPGCFNMTTGPAHWELLQRARALDNQLYFASCSQARDPEGSYVAWGHSTVTSPWGEVISKLDEKPGTMVTRIDLGRVDEVRAQIPLRTQRRTDMYETVDKTRK